MQDTDLDALFPAHLATVMERASRALEHTGYRGLLVHAGTPPGVFLDDQHYPYRAHAPFRYWAPLESAPGSFVYFEPGRRPHLLFQAPADYWHKPARMPDAGWVDAFEVTRLGSHAEARAVLPGRLDHVAYVGEAFDGLETFGVAACNPQPLLDHMDFDRARKTPYELACLRAANRIGMQAHRAAAQAFAARASEYEIAFAFMQAAGVREQELPYNPIVALNEGGAVLHYQLLERSAPAEHRSLLIDAGVSVRGYGCDITRTYSYRDADFAALVGQMDELQQSLCAGVRAGADWRDVHLTAHRLLAELLRDADLIRCDPEAAVDRGVSSVFFPHGLGHLLGLQVHDVGGRLASPEGGEIPRPAGHPALRLTRVLEEDFVVTMEPGLYFIDALLDEAREGPLAQDIHWRRVETLAPFGGIRIEDDLAVTASGCENLTRGAAATS